MKKYLFVSLMILLVCALALGACTNPAPATTSKQAPTQANPMMVKLACSAPPVDIQMGVLMGLQASIPQATGGRVKFTVYPAAQLYTDQDAIIALQSGTLEATSANGGTLSTVVPEFDILTTFDFLFDSGAHLERFLKTNAYKALLSKMESQGIKMIGDPYILGDVCMFQSKKPFSTIADMRGLKLMAPPSPILQKIYAVFSADAVVVPLENSVSALETRMVDGITGAINMMPMMELWRLTPYATLAPYHIWPMGIAVSTKWWNTVPSDLQKILTTEFSNAQAKFKQVSIENQAKMLKQYQDYKGTTYNEMSAAEKTKGRDMLKPLRDEVSKNNQLIADIFKAADETR